MQQKAGETTHTPRLTPSLTAEILQRTSRDILPHFTLNLVYHLGVLQKHSNETLASLRASSLPISQAARRMCPVPDGEANGTTNGHANGQVNGSAKGTNGNHNGYR